MSVLMPNWIRVQWIKIILAISFVILCFKNSVEASDLCSENGNIVCPCGKTGKFFKTKCNSLDSVNKDPCDKFSFCESCIDGLETCSTCPANRNGPYCSLAEIELALNEEESFSINKVLTKRSTSCSDIRGPKAGSIRCWTSQTERECTGRCIPGYSFQNRNEEEIVLRCINGRWAPQSHFPPCISGGVCDLEITGAGRYNCTSEVRGTYCDVMCTGHPRISNRYFCYPGREWEPSLPYCVRRKGGYEPQPPPRQVYDCRCQNGGICNVQAEKCECPNDFEGVFCERRIVRKSYCPDPGHIKNGDRINNGAMWEGKFEEGASVVYTCRSDYGLIGQSLLRCQKSGRWSHSLPSCQRIQPVTVKPVKKVCPDPGFIDNGDRWTSEGRASSRGDIFEVGKTVAYSCRDGYALEGLSILTCLESRQWSNILPSCKRMQQPVVVSTEDYEDPIAYCPDPGTVKNAVRKENPWISAKRQAANQQEEFPEGFKMTYQCKKGYRLQGESTLLCLFTGVWSSAPPTCELSSRPDDMAYCKDPGNIPNGDKIVILPIHERRRQGRSSGFEEELEYPEGHKLQYECFEDYRLRGKKIIACLNTGKWDAPIPTCVPS